MMMHTVICIVGVPQVLYCYTVSVAAVFILPRTQKKNERAYIILAEWHFWPGMMYNIFYVGPVWSRDQINATEASKVLVSQHTWFLSALTGSPPNSPACMTSLPHPFALGFPGSGNTPNVFCLPQKPTLSRIRLFSLIQVKLGKLVQ